MRIISGQYETKYLTRILERFISLFQTMILFFSRPLLGNFVQLFPHVLQQLGKLAVPFVELKFSTFEYSLRYLSKFVKASEECLISLSFQAHKVKVFLPFSQSYGHRHCGQSRCCRSDKWMLEDPFLLNPSDTESMFYQEQLVLESRNLVPWTTPNQWLISLIFPILCSWIQHLQERKEELTFE